MFGKKCARAPKKKSNDSKTDDGAFSFEIKKLELFLFSTGVSILAFKTEIVVPDIRTLINARAAMKMVCATKYRADVRERPFSLMNIAMESVKELGDFFPLDFFYYATNPIAYVTSLFYSDERPGDDDILHLQANLPEDRNLSGEFGKKQKNIISISENLVWSVSNQSSVCLCTDYHNNSFLEVEFPSNFCKEYMYMFIFLLHQKYTLYFFLTQIDTELENNIQKLEEYKRRLSDFKTYFVFSQVSEIVNYQLLYDEVCKAFCLEHMYEDVNEPLMMLDAIMLREEEKRRVLQRMRTEQTEKEQEERDNRINLLLALLSLLGLFSAGIDGVDLATKLTRALGNLTSDAAMQYCRDHLLHLLFLLAIGSLSAFVIIRLLVNRKKENTKMKNKCLYLGVFFDAAQLTEKLVSTERRPLEKEIENLHVTVRFRPEEIPVHLFGERVSIIVKGYGYDDKNEGVLVEVSSDNYELNQLLATIPVPHITLSVSEDGRCKDTSGLTFHPIKVFEFTGTFGEMTKDNKINTGK